MIHRRLTPGDLPGLGVRDLLLAIAGGTLDPMTATSDCLERISSQDPTIGAFVWVDTDGALEVAAQRGRELNDGISAGPLHGLPIAVKELVDVAGAPSEYSSQTRLGERAAVDAAVVRLLRLAGAVVIGTTRSHEFGWGITTQHVLRGGTRNPRALDRVPGGSSGGAAAAVAAGMVPACVATDTGGSIRIPSSYCGVAGIKPTFGTVPRQGVVPLAPSLDTVGLVARHVDDLEPILAVMQGTAVGELDSRSPSLVEDLQGRMIGFAPRLIAAFGDASRVACYEGALAECERAGVRLAELATPTAEEFRAVFTVVQGFEAAYSHREGLGLYPREKDRYGSDVAGRLEWASTITRLEYDAARRQALALTRQLATSMHQVEALLTPIALVAPPFIDAPDTAFVDGVPMPARDAVMDFTTPQNVAGMPSVAFPAGLASDGLPFGLQVTCLRGRDRAALDLGGMLERLLSDRPAERRL